MLTIMDADTYPCAEFAAKHPYETYWLSIGFEEGKKPEELVKALIDAGWKEDEFPALRPLPWKGKKLAHLNLEKSGSALFNGWTLEERKANLAEARKILRKHGITNVPKLNLTLQDLL